MDQIFDSQNGGPTRKNIETPGAPERLSGPCQSCGTSPRSARRFSDRAHARNMKKNDRNTSYKSVKYHIYRMIIPFIIIEMTE